MFHQRNDEMNQAFTSAPLSVEINDLYLFTYVVDRNGFTAAGDTLGIPKSRISRRISQLEQQLGTRLLQRTSRRLSLTDAGLTLYTHCRAMMEAASLGEAAVKTHLGQPIGRVRTTVPGALAEYVLAPLIPLFMERYPNIQLQVQASHKMVDLLADNIDVALRGVGEVHSSSSLVQSRLCTVPCGLLASPAFLSRSGPIDTLGQLSSQPLLLNASSGETLHSLRHSGLHEELVVRGSSVRLHSDNIAILKHAALSGAGIGTLPLYACRAELEAGLLQWVLPQLRPRSGQLIALFPSRNGLSPAVRVWLDFLKNELPARMEHPFECTTQA